MVREPTIQCSGRTRCPRLGALMPPWLFIALLISLIAALGYQIVLVRSLRRVPIYWAVILAAFLTAEGLAESTHLHSPQLGELQVLPDLAGVVVAVGLLRVVRL